MDATKDDNIVMRESMRKRHKARAGRLGRLATLGACLLLGACSMIEFGYSQAPFFLANRIDDAFDLDSRQMDALRSELRRFHDWHREQEIPRYEALLSAAAERVHEGVTRADVVWFSDEVRAARNRVVSPLCQWRSACQKSSARV